MNAASRITKPTSGFERLPVYEDGYAESHRVARVLYRIVTNIDVDLIGLAVVLRNSVEDADATAEELDGNYPEDAMILAALAITPPPDDADVAFHNGGVEKWHRAILASAISEQWLRLDLRTLAPLVNGEEQAFTSQMTAFLDWIRRFCSPRLLTAFENEIDWLGPQESAGEQTGASSSETTPSNGFPNYEDEKQRTNNLERAVEAAMKKLGRMATVDELINFLAQSDETGFIRRWDGQEIVWINSKGKEQKTGRRGIEIHRQKYR